jgi:hypothetical protein
MKVLKKYKQKLFSLLLIFALLVQSVSPVHAATFTPGMAKRDAPGPFTAAPIVQGTSGSTSARDSFTSTRGTQVSGDFYANHDKNQGSFVLWITPEWNGNDGVRHELAVLPGYMFLIKNASNQFCFYMNGGGSGMCTSISSWTAGTTYSVVTRWDFDNTLDGTNYASVTINDSHTFGLSITQTMNTTNVYEIGGSNFGGSADALIEGFTIYRRPLFDGTYGIDVGNGDEINQIYNSGTGKDPTLITGSWDVVFALPTNSSVGALTTGTGNAWSHPHSSNLLYTSTTNTGGFMMNGTASNDGWNEIPWYELANAEGQVAAYQPIGAADLATSYINLANPGTYNAAPGVAPAWDATNGWTFSWASGQYLTTSAIPTGTWSAFARFSDVPTGDNFLFGTHSSPSNYAINIRTATDSIRYSYGSSLTNIAPEITAGVVGIAGQTGYRNGVAEGFPLGTFTGTANEIFIGAYNDSGTPGGFQGPGKIQALALYNNTLDAAEASAVSGAMAGLQIDGDYLDISPLATSEKSLQAVTNLPPLALTKASTTTKQSRLATTGWYAPLPTRMAPVSPRSSFMTKPTELK